MFNHNEVHNQIDILFDQNNINPTNKVNNYILNEVITKYICIMKNLIGIIFLFISSFAFGHKTDSIGVRVKNGVTFILHQVENGDGLYGLSRKYSVPLETIIDANPGSDQVIKIGQVIWIPTTLKPVLQDKLVSDYFNNTKVMSDADKSKNETSSGEVSTFAKYHKVLPGETLYSISKKYNTSVEMIMNLNNMTESNISVGKRILVQDGQAKTVIIKKMESSPEVEENEELLNERNLEIQVETNTTLNSSGYSKTVEKLKEYDIEKVEETGIVSVGDPQIPEDKNFAMHFNAPVGQVIMVTNVVNKKSVFVKIIGNFEKPDNSAEIIKLSSYSAKSIDIKKEDKVLLSYAIAR